ncbi:epoxide hydrolase family protein [Fodinicola feengrottensis]|uniref:Epoxide hydrolase n=1 Tax=Fodinicola feengrottensis TaxID=435914 RepID=A0ABN2HIH2_9ACTN|nr:epoxide hydrolase family protein [Fodinicola feengrottensis]
MSDDIRPYELHVPQERLDDLRDRLDRTRWPDQPREAADDGLPLDYVKDLVERWRVSYDWREKEAEINKFPQFTTEIDGTTVHFLHVRSVEPDALPLILTHGWPGSFLEFLDVIGPLTDPRSDGGDPADAFHLVIPSLPGYGPAGPLPDRGWTVERIARTWVTLMSRLGYHRYGAQGGDWGSPISRVVGHLAPAEVVGVHLNYLPTVPTGDQAGFSLLDAERVAAVRKFLANPSGHTVQQATRPQTLSYALVDSPVGQLAWLADKMVSWADPTTPIDVDRILTNVSLYWLTGTGASSSRLHFDNTGIRGLPIPCPVPIGVAVFPRDLVPSIRPLAERSYKIARWTEFDRGGHFAALEVPDLLTADIRAFFRDLR